MNGRNLAGITHSLLHLVTKGASLQVVLRNINQFAIALVEAESSTTWIKEGVDLIVCKDTAYPLCQTQPVGGMAVKIRDDKGVGLTAYMANQFNLGPGGHKIFNLSYASIVGHYAYGGGKPVNTCFPVSTTSLSILCVPLIGEVDCKILGLIKVENRLDPLGFPCGDRFSDDQADLIKQFAGIVATRILSHPNVDLSLARSFI
ncbi:MAG: hypothetical protein KKC76_01825 [Proteobacteria bacterium]|nr:hypothetical protein [Pseudomonadota bacterium]MBU4294733.1 hypothetical protein [Pseudomonadota bacterium]MCG2746283.1 hypothetical protein [Desulfobulbaceae bacterium]